MQRFDLVVPLAARSATSIGERLRTRRLELGLSQRDLAVPGVTVAHISRIESGKRQASVQALRKLAAKLDVTATWLEFGEESAALRLAEFVLKERAAFPPNAVRLARRVLRRNRPRS